MVSHLSVLQAWQAVRPPQRFKWLAFRLSTEAQQLESRLLRLQSITPLRCCMSVSCATSAEMQQFNSRLSSLQSHYILTMLCLDVLQAWQAVHPPPRGRYWTGQRPQVHAGFLKSWLAGILKDKVVSSVLKALQDQKKTPSIKRILVTGAS